MADSAAVLTIRDAGKADISAIIHLVADDDLGKARESDNAVDEAAYQHAFDEIDRDPKTRLIVAHLDGHVPGCMQLTIIPQMTFAAARSSRSKRSAFITPFAHTISDGR